MSTDGSTNSTHCSVIHGQIRFRCIPNHLVIFPILFFHVLTLHTLFHQSIDPFQQTSKKTPKSPRFSSNFPFSCSSFSFSSFYPSLAPLARLLASFAPPTPSPLPRAPDRNTDAPSLPSPSVAPTAHPPFPSLSYRMIVHQRLL